MAVAGGASQCFDMRVVDGKVDRGTYGLRQNVETDVDRAVEKLLAGEIVFCHAYEDKVQRVRLRVEAELAKRVELASAVKPETVTQGKTVSMEVYVHELELDRIYLKEVAEPAIDLFQQRMREYEATITRLEAENAELSRTVTEQDIGIEFLRSRINELERMLKEFEGDL